MLLLSATSPSKANEPRKRRRKSAHGFPGVRSGQGRGREGQERVGPERRGENRDAEANEDVHAPGSTPRRAPGPGTRPRAS